VVLFTVCTSEMAGGPSGLVHRYESSPNQTSFLASQSADRG
jgi:hypothetical protein